MVGGGKESAGADATCVTSLCWCGVARGHAHCFAAIGQFVPAVGKLVALLEKWQARSLRGPSSAVVAPSPVPPGAAPRAPTPVKAPKTTEPAPTAEAPGAPPVLGKKDLAAPPPNREDAAANLLSSIGGLHPMLAVFGRAASAMHQAKALVNAYEQFKASRAGPAPTARLAPRPPGPVPPKQLPPSAALKPPKATPFESARKRQIETDETQRKFRADQARADRLAGQKPPAPPRAAPTSVASPSTTLPRPGGNNERAADRAEEEKARRALNVTEEARGNEPLPPDVATPSPGSSAARSLLHTEGKARQREEEKAERRRQGQALATGPGEREKAPASLPPSTALKPDLRRAQATPFEKTRKRQIEKDETQRKVRADRARTDRLATQKPPAPTPAPARSTMMSPLTASVAPAPSAPAPEAPVQPPQSPRQAPDALILPTVPTQSPAPVAPAPSAPAPEAPAQPPPSPEFPAAAKLPASALHGLARVPEGMHLTITGEERAEPRKGGQLMPRDLPEGSFLTPAPPALPSASPRAPAAPSPSALDWGSAALDDALNEYVADYLASGQAPDVGAPATAKKEQRRSPKAPRPTAATQTTAHRLAGAPAPKGPSLPSPLPKKARPEKSRELPARVPKGHEIVGLGDKDVRKGGQFLPTPAPGEKVLLGAGAPPAPSLGAPGSLFAGAQQTLGGLGQALTGSAGGEKASDKLDELIGAFEKLTEVMKRLADHKETGAAGKSESGGLPGTGKPAGVGNLGAGTGGASGQRQGKASGGWMRLGRRCKRSSWRSLLA